MMYAWSVSGKALTELIEQARGLLEVPIVTGQHDLKNQALPLAEPVSHRRGFAQVIAPGNGRPSGPLRAASSR